MYNEEKLSLLLGKSSSFYKDSDQEKKASGNQKEIYS
jgi:hypothetical protein